MRRMRPLVRLILSVWTCAVGVFAKGDTPAMPARVMDGAPVYGVGTLDRVFDGSPFVEVAIVHGDTPPSANAFRPLLTQRDALARYPNEAWFRTSLTNSADTQVNMLIEIPQPRVGYLDTRVTNHRPPDSLDELGAAQPARLRPISHVNPTMPLRFLKGERHSVLLHARSTDNLTFTPRAWTARAFAQRLVLRHLLVGLAIGALLALCAYNAIVYWISREKKFLMLPGVFAS